MPVAGGQLKALNRNDRFRETDELPGQSYQATGQNTGQTTLTHGDDPSSIEVNDELELPINETVGDMKMTLQQKATMREREPGTGLVDDEIAALEERSPLSKTFDANVQAPAEGLSAFEKSRCSNPILRR